ncbi:sugar phosphate exchanger 3 [Trichinella spiralis]|uniref:sugar phosphate exchanger 3 n=1 Tax=Trichinella spiralis TaxID=6334 RepID=UPI0001EFB44C|nr:sugar phosphate exchanger 3 [Trichinella spiralis]
MGQFCQSCTVYHVLTFLLTFFSYTLLHASRKTFSNVKSTMVAVWTAQNKSLPIVFDGEEWSGHEIFETSYAAENFLGVLDAIFMFCYATVDLQKQKQLCFIRGLFINGILGDRFDPRLVLAFGMWGSAITNFLFGTLTEWLQFYSIPFYVIIWIVNGFVQSAGWPAEVCIMANWFGRGGRGLILGLWSACASIGNIVGAELAALYTFLVNATLLFCGGFVIFFGLASKPSQLCLPEPTEEEENVADDASSTTTDEEQDLLGSVTDVKKCNQQKSIPFFKAVLLPGYSIAYACLKLVNYSIFFWLPYYLTNNFGWPEHVADHISTWFDWGGIFGGIVGGLISDLIGKRTPVICAQLVLATVALFAYTKSPNDMIINALLMGVAGFFCSGPGNLISAAVSADLGRQKEVANNAQAMSTVTGIVDGTGSVGAAIGQLAIPHLQANLGWNSVFYLFICMISCKDQWRRIFKFVYVCVDIWFIVSLNCFGWREACGHGAVMLEKSRQFALANGCDGALLVAALYQRMPSDNSESPKSLLAGSCEFIYCIISDDDLSAHDLHFQSNNVRLFVLNNERQTKSTVSLSTVVLVMMMMMMKAAVGIWSILLPVLFRLLVGHCPPPILVKPCVCTSDQSWNKPVDNFGQPLPSVVNVTCQHGKSWSRLRDALRPFRGGRYILHTLHLEKVHDATTNGRAGGARGLFRNLHIGELLLHDCRLDRWRRDVFINTTVYAISIVSSKAITTPLHDGDCIVEENFESNIQPTCKFTRSIVRLQSAFQSSFGLWRIDAARLAAQSAERRSQTCAVGRGKVGNSRAQLQQNSRAFQRRFRKFAQPARCGVEPQSDNSRGAGHVRPVAGAQARRLGRYWLFGFVRGVAVRLGTARLVGHQQHVVHRIALPGQRWQRIFGSVGGPGEKRPVRLGFGQLDQAGRLGHPRQPAFQTSSLVGHAFAEHRPTTGCFRDGTDPADHAGHVPQCQDGVHESQSDDSFVESICKNQQPDPGSAHATLSNQANIRSRFPSSQGHVGRLRWLNWRALLPLTALRLVDLSYNEFRDRSYYIRGRRSHRLAFPLDRRILPASVEELSLAGNGLHRVPVRCTGRLPELRLAILFQCEIDRTQFEQQPHFSASSESVRRSQQSPALESRLESASHHRGGGISRPVALFGLDPRPAQANRQRLLGVVETPPPLGPELQRSENDPRQRGNPLDCSCKLLDFVDWLTVNAVTLSTSGTICYTPKSLRYLHPLRDLCWSSCQTDNGTSSTGGDNFRNRDSLHFCKPI